MSATPERGHKGRPQSHSRSCEFCRNRKVRCDAQRPTCGSCIRHKQHCVYVLSAPKARPTRAMVEELRAENERLRDYIRHLDNIERHPHNPSPGENSQTSSQPIHEAHVERSQDKSAADRSISVEEIRNADRQMSMDNPNPDEQNDVAPDVSPFLWADEKGNMNVFGPSSALQSAPEPQDQRDTIAIVHARNALLASALFSRQQEHRLRSLDSLDGVPIDLAIHLLDVHWNRQHHTFLLTYRPAIMRDIFQGGRFSSKFLLNAIFGVASKFSRRHEVLDDPEDPKTAGGRFFRRCDELLTQENLLFTPSLSTIVGLLLLGSTYNARGMTSKAWLLTGYALRMVFDLGLHLNHRITHENAEEIEIYRRVFWGAFICDKLQSLYMGRPVAIKLRDAHVSHEFNDIMEENELWTPYLDPMTAQVDPSSPSAQPLLGPTMRSLTHSVSCFQQLRLLFCIVSRIIDDFYVVGTTTAHARASLPAIDAALEKWEANLPGSLRVDAATGLNGEGRLASPNIMILHIIYNATIILLHRPLISGGHLKLAQAATASEASWKRCSAAAKNNAYLLQAYRSMYTLRAAPYIISYGLYVACTILVRNAAAAGERDTRTARLLAQSLHCLEELSVPNPGVTHPIMIIRKLMAAKGVTLGPEEPVNITRPNDQAPPPYYDATARHPNIGHDAGVFDPSALGTNILEWDGWQESYNEDALFGFMGNHMGYGAMMPDMMMGGDGHQQPNYPMRGP